jgi:thioredoxin reductase
MASTEALVIGAGPFGVSISAYLRELGVEHQIVGKPMDNWRDHMPAGMLLKSEPYGSSIASPERGYDVRTYCEARGLDYVDRLIPLPLDRFLNYADWFTGQLVPDVRDVTVTEVTPIDGGFSVAFADAAPVTTRQLVVATGLRHYMRVPDEFAGLPSDLVSHSSDPIDLDDYKGRRVAVIGAGQSALETAALLNEAGADVTIIARGPEVSWADQPIETRRLFDRMRSPMVHLCEGWTCVFWSTPVAWRRLPLDRRATKAFTNLGPFGTIWLKARIEGVVEVLTGHRIRSAEPQGSGVRLVLDGPKVSSIDVDHVVAGTGFSVDLRRLSFLSAPLQAGVKTYKNQPLVSRAGESAVPGLYFAGAHTAASLGPSARFVAGTHDIASQLTKAIARRSRGGHRPPLADLSGQELQPSNAPQ